MGRFPRVLTQAVPRKQEFELTETDEQIPPVASAEGAPSMEQEVTEVADGWKAESKGLSLLAAAFAPFTRESSYRDMTKVPALIERTRQKAADLGLGDRAEALLGRVTEGLQARRKSLYENLAKDLRAACDARGLDMKVLRRDEPVEVRILPLGVTIDRVKGRATLHFARQTIIECSADAEEIVDAHQKSMGTLGGQFDAEAFFSSCHKAWSAACGAGDAGAGDRVEILNFLPYLALQMQAKAFRIEPLPGNFRGYSRAQFAFDVMQLRNLKRFTQDGWRFNLGVATGTTASKKDRTIFFEDENGNGEFKLTVFFVRAEGSR